MSSSSSQPSTSNRRPHPAPVRQCTVSSEPIAPGGPNPSSRPRRSAGNDGYAHGNTLVVEPLLPLPCPLPQSSQSAPISLASSAMIGSHTSPTHPRTPSSDSTKTYMHIHPRPTIAPQLSSDKVHSVSPSLSPSSCSSFPTVSTSTSSPSRTLNSAQNSPKSRDKPYRPPPSSSAKYYVWERQQWQLAQNRLLQAQQQHQQQQHHHQQQQQQQQQPHQRQHQFQAPSPPPSRVQQQQVIASPSLTVSGRDNQLQESRRLSISLAQSLLRRASMETVGDPANIKRETSSSIVLAASVPIPISDRSGQLSQPPSVAGSVESDFSVANSFTRSRMSINYADETDNEIQGSVIQHATGRSNSNLASLRSRPQQPLGEEKSFSSNDTRYASITSVSSDPRSSFDLSSHSRDMDWDQELGITDNRLNASHLLPAASIATVKLPSPDPETNSAKLSTSIGISSVGLSSIRGIRVTQSVSESWDDDFLFQNDSEEATGTDTKSPQGKTKLDALQAYGWESDTSPRAQPSSSRMVIDGNRWRDSSDDEPDEIENWDNVFSWKSNDTARPTISTSTSVQTVTNPKIEANPIVEPNVQRRSTFQQAASSSNSKSSQTSLQVSEKHAASPLASILSPDPNTVVRAKRKAINDRSRTSSTSSLNSDTTDLSARLAAQSDVSSWKTRSSSGHSDEAQDCYQQNALGLGLDGIHVRAQDSLTSTYDTGDETETESALPPPKATKRTEVRSLVSSFGFARQSESQPSPNRSRASEKSSKRHSLQQNKAHQPEPDTQISSPDWPSTGLIRSSSKVGYLYRFGKTGSRAKLGSESTHSLNSMPTSPEVQTLSRLYHGDANQSMASVISQSSVRSNHSNTDTTPSALERSYRALRNSKLIRAVRSPKQQGSGADRSPSRSPRNRRSSLADHLVRDRQSLGFASEMEADTSIQQALSQIYPNPPATGIQLQKATGRGSGHKKGSASLSLGFGFSKPSSWTTTHGSRSKTTEASDTKQADRPISTPQMSQSLIIESPAIESNTPSSVTSTLTIDHDILTPPNDPWRLSPARRKRDPASTNTLRGAIADESLHKQTTPKKEASEPTTVASQTHFFLPGKVSPRNNGRTWSHDRHSRDRPILQEQATRGRNFCEAAYCADQATETSMTSGSRSVSLSTTTSGCSSDTGSKLHFKDTSWSGFETNDSETTYGTSIGSISPSGKYFPASFSLHDRHVSGQSFGGDVQDTSRLSPPSSRTRASEGYLVATAWSTIQSMSDSPLQQKQALQQEQSPTSNRNRITPRSTSDSHQGLTTPFNSVGRSSSANVSQALGKGDNEEGKDPASANAATINPGPPLPTLSHEEEGNLSTKSKRPIPRRNSLSDLKIPSRISKAQIGIRANITLVKEFAKGVEDLKALKVQYEGCISMTMTESRRVLDNHNLSVEAVQDKVKSWLECADVIIGLGEGRSDADSFAQVETVSHSPAPALFDPAQSDQAAPSLNREPATANLVSTGANHGAAITETTTKTDSSGRRFPSSCDRNVNPQREFDLLTAMLGGSWMSGPASQAAPHTSPLAAEQPLGSASETSRRSGDLRNESVPKVCLSGVMRNGDAGTITASSGLTFAEVSPPFRKKDEDRGSETAKPSYPYNTAPALGGSRTSFFGAVSAESIDVGDGNKSAKRRLRSASRAGLQGLKELLKAFRSSANEEETPSVAESQKNKPCVSSNSRRISVEAPASGAEEPENNMARKQVRRSITTKRQSFSKNLSLGKESGVEETASPPSVLNKLDGQLDKNGKAHQGQKTDRSKPPLSPEKRRSSLFGRRREESSLGLQQSQVNPTDRRGSVETARGVALPFRSASDSATLESAETSLDSNWTRAGLDRLPGLDVGQAKSQMLATPPLRVSRSGSGRRKAALLSVNTDRNVSSMMLNVARGDNGTSLSDSQSGTAKKTKMSKIGLDSNDDAQSHHMHGRLPSHTLSPSSYGWGNPLSPSCQEDTNPITRATATAAKDRASGSGNTSFTLDSASSSNLSFSNLSSFYNLSTDSSTLKSSSTDSNRLGTSKKLALRPEAMPSLLVYIQATKQHLYDAIEELNRMTTPPLTGLYGSLDQ